MQLCRLAGFELYDDAPQPLLGHIAIDDRKVTELIGKYL